jgi:hypothetical protein
MKRISTSVALVALFGLAGCKGGGASDPAKLVPDAATIVGGVNVKGLLGSKLYSENKALLETGEAKEMMEAAKACNIDPNGIDGLTFGADPTSEGVVIIVSAAGIAKEENLNCIAGKIKEKAGEDPWTLEDKDGQKTLKLSDDQGVGYLIGENMVAVASKNWADSVKQLIDGKGTSAADGKMKDLVGRAPKGQQIWFAGNIPADAAAGLKGTPGEAVKDFSGGLDLANGLAMSLAAGVADAAAATALQGELQKQFDQVKGMGAAMGVPQGVIDSIKIGAADATVTLELAASNEDLKALQEKMGGMMGGLMGGGMGGPPPGMDAPPPMDAPPAMDPAAAPPAEAAPAGEAPADPAPGE